MVDQEPELAGPSPTGHSQGGPNDPISSLQRLEAAVAAGAATSAQAYRQAFTEISADLDNILLSKFKELGKLDTDTLTAFRTQFKEQESIAKNYFNIVSSEEEKRVRQIQDNLRKQESVIIKFHETLRNSRQKDAKDEAEKEKIALEERERAKKAISGVRAQAHTQEVGGGVLGSLGTMLASELSGVLAPVLSMLTIQKMAAMASDTSKTFFSAGSAASRASGTTESMSTYGGFRTIRGAFHGLHGISEGEESDILGKTHFFDRAPQLLNKSLTPAVGIMVQLGYSVEQATELIAKGSESANSSVEQLADTLQFSSKAAQAFNFGTESTTRQLLEFTRAIRTTGASSSTANKQAQEWVATLQQTGKQMNLGTEEMGSFSQKFASAISGMAPSRAAGLVLATTGKMPGSLDDLSRQVGGGQDLFKSVYKLISRSVGKSEQMFVPEKVAEQMGIGHVDMQFAKFLRDAMTSGKNVTEEMAKKGYQAPELNLMQASQNLVHIRGVLANVESILGVLIAEPVGRIAKYFDSKNHTEKVPEIKVEARPFRELEHRTPAGQRKQ